MTPASASLPGGPERSREAEARVVVRQVRSAIGTKPKHRGTLRALGLGRPGDRRVHRDSPSLRGMLRRVEHLVVAEPWVEPPSVAPAASATRPGEAQPVDDQPVDAQPVDEQPVDAQPVDEEPVDEQGDVK